MISKDRIEILLEQLFPICENWIAEKDKQTYFIDPIDGNEISAHYGATHMAAAMILYGKMRQQQPMYEKGIGLLKSILERWCRSKLLSAFHFDFNNFALCLIEEEIKDKETNLSEEIVSIVLDTPDSNHNTTNWLPMRWYVNMMRYNWTGDEVYLKKCQGLRHQIELATNEDGGIEDRMPKGLSFNLQYDVATVGVLQLLRIRGVDYDLSKEFQFLLNAVAPDSDINYQGRGTNQIFAWSLWVYLLASSKHEDQLKYALDFIEPKVIGMYERNNLMLNAWDGADKYLWWDYHYCSVYCAHFLLWLVLSLSDYGKKMISPAAEVAAKDTGLEIIKTKDSFVSVFSGRKEYLSENGPLVSAIWMKRYGILCKGGFGPWQGAFGNKYSNQTVLLNFCGLQYYRKPHIVKYQLLNKALGKLGIKRNSKLISVFVPIEVKSVNDRLELRFRVQEKGMYVLNFPLAEGLNSTPQIAVEVDGLVQKMHQIAKIKNQYGWVNVLQTQPIEGTVWTLRIE